MVSERAAFSVNFPLPFFSFLSKLSMAWRPNITLILITGGFKENISFLHHLTSVYESSLPYASPPLPPPYASTR